jgi:hypothetical protein
MEKGLFTKATQDAILALLAEAVKDQKPAVKLSASLGGKLAFLIADDMLADKLPEDLKTKCQLFLDAIFVAKDYDLAIVLGVDLIPELFELFKKEEPKKLTK